MINMTAVIFLALKGLNVSKLIFTNPQFNKMVLKNSGPPLHSTWDAPSKKDQIFPTIIQKLQINVQLKHVTYLPGVLVALGNFRYDELVQPTFTQQVVLWESTNY